MYDFITELGLAVPDRRTFQPGIPSLLGPVTSYSFIQIRKVDHF